MDLQRSARTIDPEILSQSGNILDGILEKLGVSPVLHVDLSGIDDRFERAIDTEVADLSGGLFGRLPAEEVPLEAFRIDELGERAPVSRPRADSFAPVSRASIPPEPEQGPAWRPAPWVLGCALAAGLAGFVVTGALVRTTPATQPAAAAAIAEIAPEPVVLAQDPAPPVEPVAVPVTRPVPAAELRSAPHVSAAAAKVPSPEPAAHDMSLVLPPLPPKAQVAFARAAAAVAIADGGLRAASCRRGAAGATTVPVSVTFAPSGSAVRASVTGGLLVGTAEEGASQPRGAHVPAFDGEPVTVGTVVHLR